MDSDSELEILRQQMGGAMPAISVKRASPQKKSRTFNKMGLWEELEMVYKDMEQRDKDYQIAVEIGKMLLEKNKELQDRNEEIQQQMLQLQQETDAEILRLKSETDKSTDKKDELKMKVKQLEMQVKLLQTNKGDSEFKALLLSDEFTSMEEKLEKYKKQIRQLKQKSKELGEELEKDKSELQQSKSIEEELKKQNLKLREDISQQRKERKEKNAVTEDVEERERLEQELSDLALSKSRIESMMRELTFENKKLKDVVIEREEEKKTLVKKLENLSDAHQQLQRQTLEERQLLEEKSSVIDSLKRDMEEQILLKGGTASLDSELRMGESLAMETLQADYMPIPSNGPRPSHLDPDEQEDVKWKDEWRQRLETMQRKHEDLQKREEALLQENESGKVDTAWLTEELRRFRKAKAEDHSFLSSVYELRERLCDSELKNLMMTMRNVNSFADIVHISHTIIDSVSSDIQRKILSKDIENDMIRLVADLIIENCKLRKIANDYAETLNQGTLEKLESFKKKWPMKGPMAPKTDPTKSKSVWQKFPLFDFFSGWSDN